MSHNLFLYLPEIHIYVWPYLLHTPSLAQCILVHWAEFCGLLVYADQSSGLLTVIFPHA